MNKEILYTIDSLSNEKSLEKEKILNILENSLEILYKKKFKYNNIKVIFDKKSCKFFLFKYLKIKNNTNKVDNNVYINDINNNNNINKNYIKFEINDLNFSRVNSKFIKNILFNKIKNIEKESLINNFKKLLGNIFLGTIKKIYDKKIILDIGYEFEAILYKSKSLFNDKFFLEKKIKVILYDIKYDSNYGIKLLVSRSHIYMLYILLFNNLNFYKNNIEIINIARYPGYKSKIVIKHNNGNIDLNKFILKNKYKINKISNYLNNEIIDIIIWNNNIIKFIENIIFPIKFKFIKLKSNVIDLFINKLDIKFLLGKNNINIKLINKLIDIPINIKL